jgi:hypothetical protein
MASHRVGRWLVIGVAVALASGCGNQPARVLAPGTNSDPLRRAEGSALRSLTGDLLGPTICFSNSFLDYCYSTPGYSLDPEREVIVPVRAGARVAMSWSATATAGRTIRLYRWAVDIEDVVDNTPRIDENTDLSRWSRPSPNAVTVELGPWSDGEEHRLFVEVEDSMGWKSLGIVRFVAGAGVNHAPVAADARAELARAWPPNRQLVPVTITGVTDPDGDPVTITVTGVTQDEPVDGGGDGGTCPDALIAAGDARVRLERSGSGNGRVYTLAFTATDGHGGVSTGSVDVCIPKGHGPGQDCIKDALVENSLGPCTSLRAQHP